MSLKEWMLYFIGPMMMLFVIGSVYVFWFFRKRRYTRDLDHQKTIQNVEKNLKEGKLSEEDAKVIKDSMGVN